MADAKNPHRFDVRDLIALVGVALVSGGVWMVYPPAALIVSGMLFIAGAWLSARR